MSLRSGHADLAIHRSMEVEREEYLEHMTFEANHSPMFTEIFGPMVGLKDEWRAQGASEAELEMSAFRYRRPMAASVPVNTGFMGGQAEKVLDETDECIVGTDRYGRTVKLFKQAASIPLPLDYPVRDMDDWRAFKRHYEFSEARFSPGWEDAAREARAAGKVVRVSIPGGFDEPRQLLGEEGVCVAFYEQPELIHDILRTIGETARKVLDRVSATVQVDQLNVHEDMAGKSGPLAGPKQVREFIAPYYLSVWEMLRDRGARTFDQDSDGNMNAVVQDFIDAGVNVMHPLEPAAGMDVVALRREHGERLAFVGGLDKHCLRRGERAIVEELEYKIPPMMRTGGCVLGLDHRIPNGTPLEAYRFYVRKAWEIMEREAGGDGNGS
ncbi:MAG: uroporphyrinogen decarboxylase family protein [Armatimonadota bacterium]